MRRRLVDIAEVSTGGADLLSKFVKLLLQSVDLTLLLDIPIKDGMKRKVDNDSEWNRLDAYAEAFHCRVRQGYLTLAESDPERWVIIDAAQNKEQVQKSMQQAILDRLP